MPLRCVRPLNYETWGQLKTDLFKDLFHVDRFEEGVYAFRGQSSSEWRLVSSFDRWYGDRLPSRDRVEVSEQLLKAFARRCRVSGGRSPRRGRDLAHLARAQHHGLPTRLLDWTESPYVAAFFAFHAHLAPGALRTEHVAIWALRLKAPPLGRGRGVEVVRMPELRDDRLENQRGLFTICSTQHESLEESFEACCASEPRPRCKAPGESGDACLTRVVVPAAEAEGALADLAAMDITAQRLFPGLDGAAMAAAADVLLRRP